MEENPYAPPAESSFQTGWYAANLFACRYDELCVLVPSISRRLLIVAFKPLDRLGLVRRPVQFAFAADQYDVVTQQEVPQPIWEQMQPGITIGEELGFTFEQLTKPHLAGRILCYTAAGRSSDGRVIMRVIYIEVANEIGTIQIIRHAFQSELADETFLVTAGQRKELRSAPRFLSEFCPDLSPTALCERHLQRLSELPVSAVVIADAAQLAEVLGKMEAVSVQWNVERGFYVQLNTNQLAALQQATAVSTAPTLKALQDIRGVAGVVLLACFLVIIPGNLSASILSWYWYRRFADWMWLLTVPALVVLIVTDLYAKFLRRK